MNQARAIPIRRVGNKDNLFLGGDRELVMSLGAAALILIFTVHTLLSKVAGILLWTGGLWVARMAARADPKLRLVYQRHRRYAAYYSARSTPFRTNSRRQVQTR